VLRLKHPTTGVDTGRGIALTTDGNHRWCAVDPRQGTALTVAESLLNLACVGARPLAVVNCLNFGNPEHPEVMWQLSEAIDGMSEACVAFNSPVIGGNVSLYNESQGTDIDPTPVVGMLGVIDALDRRPPGVGLVDQGRLMLIGVTQPEVSGSRWARARGHRGGTLPALDHAHHLKVADVVRKLVIGDVVAGVHDVSGGGIGVALAEMAAKSGIGVSAARVANAAELFAEGPSRVVVCVEPESMGIVENLCAEAGVPVSRIGVAGGDRFSIKGLVDLPLSEVIDAWTNHIPAALGAGTAQD
jgi:phosphoribosylformylglycinamidine synthase